MAEQSNEALNEKSWDLPNLLHTKKWIQQ